MNYLSSLVAAIIATYAASRLTWRALPVLPPPWRLIAAHALSFALLCALIMTVKSYFSSFPVGQILVLIGPTLFWLVLDMLRGRGDRPVAARQGRKRRGTRDR